ncbi:Sapep family Mn(2+)-dependent dipeptidase [Myxococcota bacterium]|nr:Sapep family Mn(2+)-dependent dipeptidase [Myxococcota bacterium]
MMPTPRPRPRRASTARAAVALLSLAACAHGAPVPTPPREGTAPAVEAPSNPSKIVDVSPSLSAEARAAELDATCGDPARFGEVTFARAEGETKAALARVRARVKGADGRPVGPVTDVDRAVLEGLVRDYLARCGLRDAIELTTKLVELPTVSAREPAATGESFRAMSDHLAAWSARAGLDYRVFGANDAWEVGLGAGPAKVAFVMHADVVPIDDEPEPPATASSPAKSPAPAAKQDVLTGEPLPEGWSKPPFRATVADGKLWGRGTEDDKGPIATALVMMRAMAGLGLEPRGRIVAILGTGEEHDWEGMRRYVAALEPKPTHTISIDAEFPVVVAESGFVAWHLAAPLDAPGPKARPASTGPTRCARIVDAKGGQFLTQVPGEAHVLVEPARGETIERFVHRAKAAAAAAEKDLGPGLRAEIEPKGAHVSIRALGTAVHSSVADEGHNALWLLAKITTRLALCSGGADTILDLVAERFAGDHWGERLGLGYEDPVMGKLLVVPTVLRLEGTDAKLSINMRRPAGRTKREFEGMLDDALARLQRAQPTLREVPERWVGEPALANRTGPLVSTLLDVYREHAGALHPADVPIAPLAIRGGTYARLFPGAVSFGPALVGRPYRGHAPDEYIELDALRLLATLLFEATLRLDALP